MTAELLERFLSTQNFDVRRTHNGRWIDQKCTLDELCFVADCIFDYVQETGKNTFKSPTIWKSDYAIEKVQLLFNKPDPTSQSVIDEYNKFFRQPMKMLSAAGVLSEKKNQKKRDENGNELVAIDLGIQFSVENIDVLEYLSTNNYNCHEFLCRYIEHTLKDSGLWDAFETFFQLQTRDAYYILKDRFFLFCKQNTPIRTKTEANRIFTKVLNPLCVKYRKKGTVRGNISSQNMTLSDLQYNRVNFRDKNKNKTTARRDAVSNTSEVFDYEVERAKKRVKRYNAIYNMNCSELTDLLSIAAQGIHIHHIFPKESFPSIATSYENLIAITPAQHLQNAHPGGNTRVVDRGYQYNLLVQKTDTIRKNINGLVGQPGFYSFDSYMNVLNTGLDTDIFSAINYGDYRNVLTSISVFYR